MSALASAGRVVAAWLKAAADCVERLADTESASHDVAPTTMAVLDRSGAESHTDDLSSDGLAESPEVVPEEIYIDLESVARRLGYSERWVYERIRVDGLPSHQRARGMPHRFLWSEVQAWHSGRGG
jgi:predicted DNA-binding transcriptional regulator AlpA